MDLGNHYTAFELRLQDEQRLQHHLERRRVIAERIAERVAETAGAAEGVTDAARPRRGIRAVLPAVRLLKTRTPLRSV